MEDKFSVIANANIHGVFHIYEAARKTGCSRIMSPVDHRMLATRPPKFAPTVILPLVSMPRPT